MNKLKKLFMELHTESAMVSALERVLGGLQERQRPHHLFLPFVPCRDHDEKSWADWSFEDPEKSSNGHNCNLYLSFLTWIPLLVGPTHAARSYYKRQGQTRKSPIPAQRRQGLFESGTSA